MPLALAGLAALRHRGAFAADGESSDGAGVALPLEPAIVERIAPGLGRRPGVVALFLPRGRIAGARARELVAGALAAGGLAVARWRKVPLDASALGRQAAATCPAVVQALVRRPERATDAEFEFRLVLARRRLESAAHGDGSSAAGLSVVSSSCRTVVYKGLVAGDRLGSFYPDLAAPLPTSHAVFHQRYATNTHPTWALAQPFRWLAHNGEIDTVRGNREQLRGRAGDVARSAAARRLLAAGPLLGPGGSDSRSLDEAVELLVATGWPIDAALAALVPSAAGFSGSGSGSGGGAGASGGGGERSGAASLVAPWDGPAAIVFGDGRRVGALVDRSGLRPLALTVTTDGLVAAASEAGAIPLSAGETMRRDRLGPGEMIVVDPRAGRIALGRNARRRARHAVPPPRRLRHDGSGAAAGAVEAPAMAAPQAPATAAPIRFLAGLHAENARLDVRTMAIEGHEPLWSMGDDTPLAGCGRVDRPVADHLRQAFAQVTNPAIDPERERIVMDLGVEVGRRAPLLGGRPKRTETVWLDRPVVADLSPVEDAVGRRFALRLDATWRAAAGPDGLLAGLDRIARDAVRAARAGRTRLVVLSDRRTAPDRPPIPSVLAAGAVHTALTNAGLRGRCDLVIEAADVLDVHGLAMALAAGATVACPWLAIELAAEIAGGRGAEALSPEDAVANLLDAFEAGLRKTLARMGIATAASYVGGGLFETLELSPTLVARCFPAAAAWPGTVGEREIAERQLRRIGSARGLAPDLPSNRLPDPGIARFRADGERHLFAPSAVGEIQALAAHGGSAPAADGGSAPAAVDLHRFREGLRRPPALVRDSLVIRRPRGGGLPLEQIEPARSIVRRFVVSAMSVGALSPEAHQTLTVGIARAGGVANTGEGGEDPAWYEPGPDGVRHDAPIKQVASGRFGVTATYLARGDQLEIKIAQGSKPGEGGQLPGRKATAYIAALRRGQPGQSYISPPPHHDIYSIEDLAQLIADLRAINPSARIGVKLVATRGIGTIAAGVAKAGADYIHLSGHAGGTGASPLSSIKHVGAPWELGLAEVHQTLLRNDLRDRVALRTDGGLQTGRDLLVAALLGAEEFAFGTAALVALGCDMARQCHLDTCPTGIATQREDLRAKFAGTPEHVERWALAIAEDFRHELGAVGAASVGEIVGDARRYLRAAAGGSVDLRPLIGGSRWGASVARRAEPARSGAGIRRAQASPVEHVLVAARQGQGPIVAGGLELTTADRSFGAELAGAIERGEIRAPVHLDLRGAAGQSFGAFLPAGVELRLTGTANDGVAKGLSGGAVTVRPESELRGPAADQAIAGNACLYGATAGQLHLVGRAGMRFAVRNSGAEAVAEGIGAHGCEYMTAGVVAVLGPVGANFGAGMTGGRAYLWDPAGDAPGRIDARSVQATRLEPGERAAEFHRLLEAHRAAGSILAAELLIEGARPERDTWLVEPVEVAGQAALPAAAVGSTEPALAQGG